AIAVAKQSSRGPATSVRTPVGVHSPVMCSAWKQAVSARTSAIAPKTKTSDAVTQNGATQRRRDEDIAVSVKAFGSGLLAPGFPRAGPNPKVTGVATTLPPHSPDGPAHSPSPTHQTSPTYPASPAC